MQKLFLIFTFFVSSILGDTTCDDADECEGTTISDTTVNCYGYESCESSDITATDWAYCYGYDGCYGATIEQTGGYSTGGVACNGLESCYGSTIDSFYVYCRSMSGCSSATISTTQIVCDGVLACYDSTISAPTTYGNVRCSDINSCSYSDITAGNKVECLSTLSCRFGNFKTQSLYARGYQSAVDVDFYGKDTNGHTNIYCYAQQSCYGLEADAGTISSGNIYATNYGYQGWYYATIESNSSNTMYVNIYGYDSTEGTSIYCEEGSTCVVNCVGYSCDSTSTLYCESTATCTLNCDESSYCLEQESYTASTESEKLKESRKIKNRKNRKNVLNEEYLDLENDKLYQEHMTKYNIPNAESEYKKHTSQNNKEFEKKFGKPLDAKILSVHNKNKNKLSKYVSKINIINDVVIGVVAASIILSVYYFINKKNKDIMYQRLP